MGRLIAAGLFVWFAWSASVTAQAAIVASEDFDGGAVNLISSNVPTIDGGPGDTFAVGATQAWPTDGGTPFSLVDNTVGDVGDSGVFPDDTEGVFGVNSDFTNQFLGISDTQDAVFNAPVTASWQFNIAGFTDLSLSVDMGSMEGSDFSYAADTSFVFTYSIDGSDETVAFEVAPDAAGDGYSYRPLDSDLVVVANENALSVSGANPVSKILADTGLVAGDTFLDKSVASGDAAGQMDSFFTALNGEGSTLTLSLSANIPFEAAAFDNIVIEGVPEPGAASVLGLVGMVFSLYRRRRG